MRSDPITYQTTAPRGREYLVTIPNVPVRTTPAEAVGYLRSLGYKPQEIGRLLVPPMDKEAVRAALYRFRRKRRGVEEGGEA